MNSLLVNALAWHSKDGQSGWHSSIMSYRTVLWDTLLGHACGQFCGTLWWDTLVGRLSLDTLWDIFGEHSSKTVCGTHFWETFLYIRHSCDTLVGDLCGTLMWDTGCSCGLFFCDHKSSRSPLARRVAHACVSSPDATIAQIRVAFNHGLKFKAKAWTCLEFGALRIPHVQHVGQEEKGQTMKNIAKEVASETTSMQE